MKTELKNIKHSEFASHETHCYQAVLYVDGKPLAKISNDGHGGCDYWSPHPKAVDQLRSYGAVNAAFEAARAQISEASAHDYGTDGNFEIWCGDQVNAHLKRADALKVLRKLCAINADGELLSWPAKYKPTAANIEKLRAQFEPKGHTILNALPKEDAIKRIVETLA